jgi:hypothetical protein
LLFADAVPVPIALMAETLKIYVPTPHGELPKLVVAQFDAKTLHEDPPFEEDST